MGRKARIKEVQKFGGIDELGAAKLYGHKHDVSTAESMSQTHLEDDVGHGEAAIIRCFEFGMNPEAFQNARSAGMQVTKQDLFNYHHKGIEMALWKDGMKIIPESHPEVLIDEKAMKYKIFVGARPRRGHLLLQKPQTLREIAHGR